MIRVIREISEEESVAALAEGATLLTSSHQLAVDWKRRFVESTSAAVCETPNIFSWYGWIQTQLNLNERLPVSLTSLQELSQWQRIIRNDLKSTISNTQAITLSRSARHAYRLMYEYQANAGGLVPGNVEHEAFHRWFVQMQGELKAANRILAADVAGKLIEQGHFECPDIMLLDGFQELTPLQQKLFTSVQQSGVQFFRIRLDNSPGELSQTCCEDTERESRHVATRISILRDENPEIRIGILYPRGLEVESAWLWQLNETLLPEDCFDPQERRSVIDVEIPLSDTPLGSMSLYLLSLAGQKQLAFAKLEPLLLSPYISAANSEREARAALDVLLRSLNQHTLWLPTATGRDEWKDVPGLCRLLHLLLAWKASPRRVSEWIKAVRGLWRDALALASDMSRSPFEIRQINALQETTGAIIALDDGRKMNWQTFLAMLRQTLTDATVRQVIADGRIIFVPLEQAAGLRFDHVFVPGMDEERWPMSALPHSLIPVEMQSRYRMPGATARAAFAESEGLWTQICKCAPALEISFASQRDGRDVVASPVLEGLPRRHALTGEPAWQDLLPELTMEEVSLDVVPLPGYKIPGGAYGLLAQSACPFRYFTGNRLRLGALEETEPGLSLKEKGTLVHKVLEGIWQEVCDQKRLSTLFADMKALHELIGRAIDEGWQAIRRPVDRNTFSLEGKRLHRLMLQWLQKDQERPAFEVAHLESPEQWRVSRNSNTFILKLKIDRIDRDTSGRLIVLDYKTGSKSSSPAWMGERPELPQLPLYALVKQQQGEPPAAVAFARARTADCGFEGLSADDTEISGINVWQGKGDDAPEEWPELIAEWQRRLETLAVEMIEGRNEVAPRDDKACAYCDLKAICRIDAMREGR